eukprot:TRINITY_DN4908_c0_g1_i4.p1 TRINITY_DN4908_c0_g1~~TRINITY_DN4908_c0_g1_i4.p1  ORF type:complete len:830 (+),score=218.41 TRINITY_DN4908_c0_g1_i4:140-2491(+)
MPSSPYGVPASPAMYSMAPYMAMPSPAISAVPSVPPAPVKHMPIQMFYEMFCRITATQVGFTTMDAQHKEMEKKYLSAVQFGFHYKAQAEVLRSLLAERGVDSATLSSQMQKVAFQSPTSSHDIPIQQQEIQNRLQLEQEVRELQLRNQLLEVKLKYTTDLCSELIKKCGPPTDQMRAAALEYEQFKNNIVDTHHQRQQVQQQQQQQQQQQRTHHPQQQQPVVVPHSAPSPALSSSSSSSSLSFTFPTAPPTTTTTTISTTNLLPVIRVTASQRPVPSAASTSFNLQNTPTITSQSSSSTSTSMSAVPSATLYDDDDDVIDVTNLAGVDCVDVSPVKPVVTTPILASTTTNANTNTLSTAAARPVYTQTHPPATPSTAGVSPPPSSTSTSRVSPPPSPPPVNIPMPSPSPSHVATPAVSVSPPPSSPILVLPAAVPSEEPSPVEPSSSLIVGSKSSPAYPSHLSAPMPAPSPAPSSPPTHSSTQPSPSSDTPISSTETLETTTANIPMEIAAPTVEHRDAHPIVDPVDVPPPTTMMAPSVPPVSSSDPSLPSRPPTAHAFPVPSATSDNVNTTGESRRTLISSLPVEGRQILVGFSKRLSKLDAKNIPDTVDFLLSNTALAHPLVRHLKGCVEKYDNPTYQQHALDFNILLLSLLSGVLAKSITFGQDDWQAWVDAISCHLKEIAVGIFKGARRDQQVAIVNQLRGWVKPVIFPGSKVKSLLQDLRPYETRSESPLEGSPSPDGVPSPTAIATQTLKREPDDSTQQHDNKKMRSSDSNLIVAR